MNDELKCSLCNSTDYDSDWGGNRWIRGFKTICPECERHFSGCYDVPILSVPHPFLSNRLKRRNNWWQKFKKKLLYIIEVIGIAGSWGI